MFRDDTPALRKHSPEVRALRAVPALLSCIASTALCQVTSYREAYGTIHRQVFFDGERKLPPNFVFPTVEERAAARKELRNLVTRTIQSSLATGSATDQSIVEAVVDLQQDRWWERRPDEPSLPFAHFVVLGGMKTMTAAFPVLSGGAGIPDVAAHIQFYSNLGGRWNLVAETGEDFEGCNFKVAPLRSPVGGQAWFLAWGRVVGDTRARLKVRLYSFDGFSVRTVWSRDELRGGGVKIEDDGSVTLTYELLPPDDQRVPPTPIIERLRPTVRGLEP